MMLAWSSLSRIFHFNRADTITIRPRREWPRNANGDRNRRDRNSTILREGVQHVEPALRGVSWRGHATCYHPAGFRKQHARHRPRNRPVSTHDDGRLFPHRPSPAALHLRAVHKAPATESQLSRLRWTGTGARLPGAPAVHDGGAGLARGAAGVLDDSAGLPSIPGGVSFYG